MSQLLQVHINQRLMKSSGSGENSPASPGGLMGSPGGGLSPLSMGPSSPQGMPIPRRYGGGESSSTQHWTTNPGMINIMSGSSMMSNAANMSGWSGMVMSMVNDGTMIESPLGIPVDPLSMEGELSKLSMGDMVVDEDDMLKYDGSQIIEPTLAELNAPDADTLLDGLNFDDLYWPETSGPCPLATPSPQTPGGGNPLDPDGDSLVSSFGGVSTSASAPTSSFLPVSSSSHHHQHHRHHNHHSKMMAASVPGTSSILDSLMQPTLTLANSDNNISSFIPHTSSNPGTSSSNNPGHSSSTGNNPQPSRYIGFKSQTCSMNL
jgi:hypothetical protein